MSTKTKKIITIAGIILALVIIVSAVLLVSKEVVIRTYEIDFPGEGGDMTVLNTTVRSADVESLEKQVSSMTGYIYCDPVITDYKIVEKFGFDIGKYHYPAFGTFEEPRLYGDINERHIEIDKYGSFIYKTGVEDTWFDIQLSDAECMSIAKQWLKENGLLNMNIDPYWTKGESMVTTNGETVVIAKTIVFHPLTDDGCGIYGNSRVSVRVNGNGEIVDVYYRWREYKRKIKADLISIEDALKRIDEQKAYISMENASKELRFESVSVHYWAEAIDVGIKVMLPVYVFEGESTTQDGSVEDFSITVQANKLN